MKIKLTQDTFNYVTLQLLCIILFYLEHNRWIHLTFEFGSLSMFLLAVLSTIYDSKD